MLCHWSEKDSLSREDIWTDSNSSKRSLVFTAKLNLCSPGTLVHGWCILLIFLLFVYLLSVKRLNPYNLLNISVLVLLSVFMLSLLKSNTRPYGMHASFSPLWNANVFICLYNTCLFLTRQGTMNSGNLLRLIRMTWFVLKQDVNYTSISRCLVGKHSQQDYTNCISAICP